MVPLSSKDSSQPAQASSTETSSGLESLNIFYVDDDENNIHALSTLMDNWGCTFSSATSPTSSLEYASEHDAPDVILMDYQLGPETNGIQLADELLGHWQNIPVCIVSAAPDEDLSTRVTGHGFDFLRKPIKPGKLRALLERYLQKKNS